MNGISIVSLLFAEIQIPSSYSSVTPSQKPIPKFSVFFNKPKTALNSDYSVLNAGDNWHL